jgi:hypothetical protein
MQSISKQFYIETSLILNRNSRKVQSVLTRGIGVTSIARVNNVKPVHKMIAPAALVLVRHYGTWLYIR